MTNFFSGIPRVQLLFAPTPLHKAERLSAELGIELWLKRDDLTGPGAFGGNKMRKLEFLIGQALAENAEYVITYGATQSNHAMQTAAACARNGLKAILYLLAVVEPDAAALRGNILLDRIFGAETNIIRIEPGETEAEAASRAAEAAKTQIARLEASGHHCVEIPGGGASSIGSLGFAAGYLEYREQAAALGLGTYEHIYHTTGSAGTLAGILSGRALAGGLERITAVTASPKVADTYAQKVVALANDTLTYLWEKNVETANSAVKPLVSGENLEIETNFTGPGYEIPSPESTAALLKLARTEGITLDPVYTAKAFAALLGHVKSGKITAGSRVLFWHTGGSAALFAEPEILGEI
jgi:1-aminocyclopropane-1-carboxylate deaminase/D-cysteine desulfhydrase-like pyridoxal-dependent ACC family enzyme